MRGVEGTMSVCRRSSAGSVFRGGCVVEEGATRESLLEVVELGEVEPNLPSVRAGTRDPARAGFQKLFISRRFASAELSAGAR